MTVKLHDSIIAELITGHVLPAAVTHDMVDSSVYIEDVRAYATSGSGTQADPWLGWDSHVWLSDHHYVFPAGWYAYSTTLTWAVNRSAFTGTPGTHLVFNGTGNAISADAGAGDLNDLRIGPFRLAGNINCTNGVSIRKIRNAYLDDLYVRDVSGAAIRLEQCAIATIVRPVVARQGVAYTIVPTNGIVLTGISAGTRSTAVTIISPDIDSCGGSGIVFDWAAFCQVLGGSSELCNRGIEFTINSDGCLAQSVDLEANITEDLLMNGLSNYLINIDVIGTAHVGSLASTIFCKIWGGEINTLLIDTNCVDLHLASLRFKLNAGGGLTDNGTNTLYDGNNFEATSGIPRGIHGVAGALKYRSPGGTTTQLAPN